MLRRQKVTKSSGYLWRSGCMKRPQRSFWSNPFAATSAIAAVSPHCASRHDVLVMLLILSELDLPNRLSFHGR